MNRSDPLPAEARTAFSLLLRRARYPRSQADIVELVAAVLPADAEPPSRSWLANLEDDPPRPLANYLWMDKLLGVLGLDWKAVHDALNVDVMQTFPDKPTAVEALRRWCDSNGFRIVGGDARTGKVVVSYEQQG